MISIIIPTFNRNVQLKQCIQSIRDNSAFENEIIVLHPFVDQQTIDLCNEMKVNHQNDNSRVNGKRVKSLWGIINDGIELASFSKVCWLNDDCLVLKDWDKYALNYFENSIGLVILKTQGLDGDPNFKTISSLAGIPCANYGVLEKSHGLRFDPKFSWYHGDSDISLQAVYVYNLKTKSTTENCIIHNHFEDENRRENNADPRNIADTSYFENKWFLLKLVEKIIDSFKGKPNQIYYLRYIVSIYYKRRYKENGFSHKSI